MDALTEKIIGTAIEVHKTQECGLLESMYEAASCLELTNQNIFFERQISNEVIY